MLLPRVRITISPVAALCLLLIGLTVLPGCVRRRMLLRSNPPGATVYVDNQLIGVTPCATDFTYYGTREVRLVKPGFETLSVNQPIPAPWFQIPPLDYVSENLVPWKIHDYRTISYDLVPQVIVPTEQLLGRAEELRQSTMQGTVMPATAIAPPTGAGQPMLLPPGAQPGVTTPETLVPVPGTVSPYPAEGIPPGGQPLEALPPP